MDLTYIRKELFEKIKNGNWLEGVKGIDFFNWRFTVGLSAGVITLGAVALQLKKLAVQSHAINECNLRVVDDDIIYNWPIFGHSLSLDDDNVKFWLQIGSVFDEFRKRYPDELYAVLMFGPQKLVYPMKPEGAADILRSQTNIRKGMVYDFLYPWLKTGLLTSTGKKWKDRRRMLTPSFHKDVLVDFVEVINEKAQTMIKLLTIKAKGNDGRVNFHWPIVMCALDIIIETAMGKESNIQKEDDNQYAKSLFSFLSLFYKRFKNIQYWPELIWRASSYGRQQARDLAVMLNFSQTLIDERWHRYQQLKSEYGHEFDQIMFGEKNVRKNRIAFLDTLLQAVDKGEMELSDIAEEVDTFMFEGHDTTAAALNWALQEIASHPDVLQRCHDEVDAVFGDSERPASMADLDSLHYLEGCIKETLRKYPSVPSFMRQLDEDCPVHQLGQKCIIPKHSLISVMPFYLHRDEQHWPLPNEFNPERFLGDAAEGRHPYSYIPFSAGPRNCIGQRFAILSEKIILSTILRSFNLKALRKTNDIPVISEVITRPQGGIELILEPR